MSKKVLYDVNDPKPEWYERMTLWFYNNVWEKRNIHKRAKWMFQRIVRGFDDRELWSLYDPLARHILSRLKAFRNQKLWGYPCCEGIECEEDWLKILDKMILAFHYTIIDMDDVEMYPIEKMYSIGKRIYFEHSKDYKAYRDEEARREKAIEEGLLLFAKYFRSLWD